MNIVDKHPYNKLIKKNSNQFSIVFSFPSFLIFLTFFPVNEFDFTELKSAKSELSTLLPKS